MSTLSKRDLERSLLAAIDQRTRDYAQTFALAVRFEKDNTKAEHETKNFQSILRAFGMSPAEEYVINASDSMPGWNLRDRFLSLLKAAHSAAGRSLVMIHYAGHGKVDVNGQLVFLANAKTPRSISQSSPRHRYPLVG
jgi:hypothetical protein